MPCWHLPYFPIWNFPSLNLSTCEHDYKGRAGTPLKLYKMNYNEDVEVEEVVEVELQKLKNDDENVVEVELQEMENKDEHVVEIEEVVGAEVVEKKHGEEQPWEPR